MSITAPAVAAPPAQHAGAATAALWRRLLARAVDVAVLAGAWFLLVPPLAGLAVERGSLGHRALSLLLFGFAAVLAEVVPVALRGATLGKRLLGLEVRTPDDRLAGTDVAGWRLAVLGGSVALPLGIDVVGAVVEPVLRVLLGLLARLPLVPDDLVSLAQPLLRPAVLVAALVPLVLGAVLVLVDDRRRGLHDRRAGTVVVRRAAPRAQVAQPPLWRDVRLLRIVLQMVVLLAIALVALYLFGNFRSNADRSNLSTGFGFLRQPAGVDIRDSDFRPTQPVRDALLVGFFNTIRVAGIGIVAATVLGTVIGIARLSTNWLVRKAAALYVELIRNIPVLVIILFFYTAVVLKLPPISQAVEVAESIVLSNRGLAVPWFQGGDNARGYLAVLAVGLAAAVATMLWRTRVFDATGAPHRRLLWGFVVFVVVAGAGYAALGGPVSVTLPGRDGRVVSGGISLGSEFAAGLIALVVYTASHIAEIVRGSIQAVPKGQTEAANAVALSTWQRLRYVILPQAFRIAIPPIANQYLNLTKNSSLVAAIGYFELTRLAQNAVANGNPAPQVYLILMGGYLFLSIVISLFTNTVNRRLSLEAR